MLGAALRKGFSFSGDPALLTGGMQTVAGAQVSPTSALAAASVYSATSLIAQTVASLPIRFTLRDDENRIPQRPPQAKTLWDKPNAYQTTSAFIETVVLSQLLWGNAYVYPRRSAAGNIVELWPIDPDRIESVEALTFDTAVGLRFKVRDFGTVDNLPGQPVDMIHLPHITVPGRVKGISPVEQLAELIGMSLSSQEHAARFLGQGVHMSGTIETPGVLKREQAKELVDGFSSLHSGPKQAGRVGVLTGGATFKPVMMPPSEMQFLEQMKYSDQKIASIYRVPPHMVGDISNSTSWGTGIEEQGMQFVRHTLLPIMRKLEEGFERAILAGTDFQMRFQTNALLRASATARAEFYNKLWMMGVISADEIRALEDLGPQPDGIGKRYYVPLSNGVVTADPTPAGAKALLDALEEGRA